MLAWLCLALAGTSPAAQWQTLDGLAISLADRTGQPERCQVGARSLRLSRGAAGGLSFREFLRDPNQPQRVIFRLGAEGEEQPWTQATFADWEASGDYVRRRTGNAAEGDAFLALGNGQDAGVGMAAAKTLPVPPGGECIISWQGRTRQLELAYILCMRVYDQRGRDITASTPPPPGWGWSPYSKAHYRVDLRHTRPDTWEKITCDYALHEEAAALRWSLRVYTGGDLRADVDDLQVAVKSGQWTEEVAVTGRVEKTRQGLRQRAEAPAHGLVFETHYRQEAGRLQATVEVTTSRPAPQGRCLRLFYRLPLDLTGWTWAADPVWQERIRREERYENSFGLSGHQISRYPLVSVSRGEVGLALAASLEEPALQSFIATGEGLQTMVAVGLTDHAPRARARFGFSLFRHDPAWTFRAALDRYYTLFPRLFAPVPSRGGAWTLRLPKPDHARPEEFGLAFYQCNPLPPQQQEACRAENLLMFPYAEPWGRRTNLGQAQSRADLPPYEQRLAFLKSLAESTEEGKLWGGAPRALMAQAVLNSLIMGPTGEAVHLVDYYTSWSQWWQLNTDPDLPLPNMASVSRQYEIDPYMAWADGLYLDSVSPYFCQWEDHDPGHLAAADLPLAFSLRTARPVVLSGFAHYEFIQQLRADLHRQGKLVMMNLHPPATRLFGHFGDVVGTEVLALQEDAEAMQQRIYACRRPVSNLLQWQSAVLKRVPAMTPAELEAYFANQLLYGFWPGISTAGGGTEPGYAHMHRYFQDPVLLNRDRALFQKYLPVFFALNEAGWEPVTYARSDQPEVRVERYGRGQAALLVVANTTDDDREATLTWEAEGWQPGGGPLQALSFRCLLTAASGRAEPVGGKLVCRLPVPARRTLVLQPANQGQVETK
jgi:hypothetical protein